MKAVILAGGYGTRIAEESDTKPKPMVEVGGKPLLWHIMKLYAHHGVSEFIICLGYKGYVIKEFFSNYYRHMSDFRIDLESGDLEILNNQAENWRVTLIDTGADTLTGGRIRRIGRYLDDETFCLTYGDGLSDVDVSGELEFHRRHGKLATIMAVRPPGRFGVLSLEDDGRVRSFEEKPSDEVGWINGGFFVLEPGVIDYIAGDQTSWEQEPLRDLVAAGELSAFEHDGFWKPCDTLRDKRELESIWNSGRAPWCVWSSDAGS